MTVLSVKISILAAFLLVAASALGQKVMMNPEDLPAMGDLTFRGKTIVLPLTAKGGHPKVNVDLGNGDPYPFIVDTGASVNVIDSFIAEKMGYEIVGEMEIGAPGGKQVPGKIVKVSKFRIGKATIKNAEFVAMDINGFSMGTMQGVLGLGLFEKYLLTFDLVHGEITVSKDRLSAGDVGVMPYKGENGKIRVGVDVAGTSVPSHIDTGSMGDFLMPAELINSLPLKKPPQAGAQARLVGGARNIQVAQLDGTIHFAGAEYKNPTLTFMDPSPGSGNIGSGIFGEFLMAIDQKTRLISFTKATNHPTASGNDKPRKLGLGIRGTPGGSHWVVSVVYPGSLAATAGLMKGDQLLSLNGQPADEYDMAKFGALFRSTTPLDFVVQRDGVQKSFAIP